HGATAGRGLAALPVDCSASPRVPGAPEQVGGVGPSSALYRGASRPRPTFASHGFYLISAGCSHLARCLSCPAPKRMRKCAHLMKTEQPRNLGYVQLGIIEVTNR